MDKKWYKKIKIGAMVGVIAGVFSILGIRFFDDVALVDLFSSNTTSEDILSEEVQKDNVEEDTQELDDISELATDSTWTDESDLVENVNVEEDSFITEDSDIDSEESSIIEVGTPFVVSVPEQDAVTNAYLTRWDEEVDRDIVGNTYSTAMKLKVSNFINAIGGGSSNITADVHIPLGAKINETWKITFVVASEMVGNGSSANITIMSGEEELYPSFTISSSTTEQLIYEVDLTGINDLVIRFDCNAVGEGVCVGIVLEEI